MLLIAEIGLTIAAWKRGWKGLALLPVIFAFGGGFIIGIAGGDSSESWLGIGFIFDIICIIVLLAMTAKPRRHADTDSVVTVPVSSVHDNAYDITNTRNNITM